ncbi:hypothetical protein ACFQ03_12285 [Paenibacillus residui]|uniref:Uncharacterized protein n=1 Tax=Paenibacillus residui TaxID=629724 RepID=A0ABW3DD06_9BACL
MDCHSARRMLHLLR